MAYRRLAKVSLVLLLLVLSSGVAWVAMAFGQTAPDASTTYESATGLDIPTSIDPVNPAAIPLGDGNVSSSPEVGYVDSCQTTFGGGGAEVDGPWINTAAKTWDSETKIAVQGSVSWPDASFSIAISGNERIITGNDEPIDHTTGTFPISRSDPAYQYDTNPNHIAPQSMMFTLPLNPTVASEPTCLGLGPVGVLLDGIYLYNALDAEGRDAGAHEVLDSFQGHPDSSDTYHHHEVPSFLMDNVTAPDSATLVGYAADGFGIYVERDASGNLLTNANLDACHGTTSVVPWNGQLVDIYHYVATIEYPYTVGCYMGSVQSQIGPPGMTTTSSTQAPPTSSTSTTSVSTTSTSATSETSTTTPASTTSTASATSGSATSTSVTSQTSAASSTSTLTTSAETSSAQVAEFPLAALPVILAVTIVAAGLLVRRSSR